MKKHERTIEGLRVTFAQGRSGQWFATIHGKSGGTLPGPSGRTLEGTAVKTRHLLRSVRKGTGWTSPAETARRRRGSERDASTRSSRRETAGLRASELVRRGQAAEERGDFSTAAVFYKKAGAAYERAKNPTRARLWKARGADINRRGGPQMGSRYKKSDKKWRRKLGRRY